LLTVVAAFGGLSVIDPMAARPDAPAADKVLRRSN
jgi:hypothetical protein